MRGPSWPGAGSGKGNEEVGNTSAADRNPRRCRKRDATRAVIGTLRPTEQRRAIICQRGGLANGAEGDRTPDLCSAIAALSQLSYSPLPELREFAATPFAPGFSTKRPRVRGRSIAFIIVARPSTVKWTIEFCRSNL